MAQHSPCLLGSCFLLDVQPLSFLLLLLLFLARARVCVCVCVCVFLGLSGSKDAFTEVKYSQFFHVAVCWYPIMVNIHHVITHQLVLGRLAKKLAATQCYVPEIVQRTIIRIFTGTHVSSFFSH